MGSILEEPLHAAPEVRQVRQLLRFQDLCCQKRDQPDKGAHPQGHEVSPWGMQGVIEETIAKNPVTVLTAETGAGKSTRVPMWMWQKRKKVHVTHPRRIAARSLALYLAKLTGTSLGKGTCLKVLYSKYLNVGTA